MTETRYIEGQSRYALSEMVGRGGFATVWRARPVGAGHLFGGRDVAVKVIPVYNEAERSRALREGHIAENLRHPNIVETLEVIATEGEVYLVTEFVQGLPLDEAGRYYGCEEIIHSLAQILEALVYAHAQGIIHRDIKPQNALVDRQGTVKLTDFGVAFRAGDTRLTRIGFAVGTPGYIAPEIMDGADPTALTDIYAVGATARTLLSHQPEESPPRLKEFVDLATSPNPSHRPQSAWAALKILTGKKNPARRPDKRSEKKTSHLRRRTSSQQVARNDERRDDYGPYREESGSKAVRQRLPERFTGGLLRTANGAAAAFLGYTLGTGVLLLGGAEAAGLAVGFAVAGYLLPRIASLAIAVALAVALLQSNTAGPGLAVLGPAAGIVWIGVSGASLKGAGKLPLGPVLSVPLALVNLAAGLPFLMGALMRPVAAGISAALAGAVLLLDDIIRGDGVLPFYGETFRQIPPGSGPAQVFAQVERIVTLYPWVLLVPALWAAMAVLVSLGEWVGKPFWGFFLAVGVGALSYALLIPSTPQAVSGAMTSLGLASIIYAALRYVVAKSSR